MNKKQQEIFNDFQSLPVLDQEELLNTLQTDWDTKGALIEKARTERKEKKPLKACPHCQADKPYRRGTYKGQACYTCRSCAKNYRENTGTALYNLKKANKIQAYTKELINGTSIKKTAKKLGISIQTSFDWRHKILSSTATELNTKVGGLIQCDEIEFPISNKGDRQLNRKPRKRGNDFKRNQDKEVSTIQVVSATDNKGGKLLRSVESKRLTSKQISLALATRIERNSTLITDQHPSYQAYAKNKTTLAHKALNAKHFVDKSNKSINLQKVNQMHSELRQFLSSYNGVSTKYMQNYLNWYLITKNKSKQKNQLYQWLQTIVESENAYEVHKLYKENVINIRT